MGAAHKLTTASVSCDQRLPWGGVPTDWCQWVSEWGIQQKASALTTRVMQGLLSARFCRAECACPAAYARSSMMTGLSAGCGPMLRTMVDTESLRTLANSSTVSPSGHAGQTRGHHPCETFG